MSERAVSKVTLNGTTLIDVTQDTVTAATLADGSTATGADGIRVTGSIIPGGGVDFGWFAGVAYNPTWTIDSNENWRYRTEMLQAKGVRYVKVTDTDGALAAVEYVYCYNASGSSIGSARFSNSGYYGLKYGTEFIVCQINTRYQQSTSNRKITPVILPSPVTSAEAGVVYGAKLIKGISVWNNTGKETADASSYATDFIPCEGFAKCYYAPNGRSHVHFYTADKASLNTGIIFQNTDSFDIPEGAVYMRRSTNYDNDYPVFNFTE